MTYQVHFVFGRRQEQDLSEYSSGATDPFVFTISSEVVPTSWQSAYVLLAFYREDFCKACLAAGTSSCLLCISKADTLIPTCYLDRPTIEVTDGVGFEELMLDGKPPNPWLSRVANAA